MKAFSKINLFLQVTGKRADQYHELDLLFYPLQTPSDELYIHFESEPADVGTHEYPISLHCTNCPAESLGSLQRNLCVRAVETYFQLASRPVPPCTISLTKNIPVAAGMGGGSSDAAATLIALQNTFHLLSEDNLKEAALSLGADVPFFLHSETSRARGIGEKLEPLQKIPSRLPILLAAPGFPVSAAWAYQHLDWQQIRRDSRTCEQMIQALQENNLSEAAKLLRNDLSHALWNKFPVLHIIQKVLLESGALQVQISGSGPTLFALFSDFEICTAAFKTAREKLDPSIRLIQPFT